jgi:protein-S-isoprenylcysteine O-methyltransferase Ste14
LDAARDASTRDASTRDNWARVARRIRVPLSFLAAVLYIWLAHPTRSSLIAGTVIIIPGLLLRALASGHVQKDKQLTTSGPYAYTRNPLYLGSLMLAVGFAIAARSWWVVAVMVLIVAAIYVPIIAAEERYLRRTFPEYEEYARQVPRMLARLTPYTIKQGAYSFDRFRKHREYQASAGCLLMLAILILKFLFRP